MRNKWWLILGMCFLVGVSLVSADISIVGRGSGVTSLGSIIVQGGGGTGNGSVVSVSGGTGLNRSNITGSGILVVNFSETQARVSGSCGSNALSAISEGGSNVTCSPISASGSVPTSVAAANVSGGIFGANVSGMDDYTFERNVTVNDSVMGLGEINSFGLVGVGGRIRIRQNYTGSPSNPPAGMADLIIVDNGITPVFRIRYNSPSLGMKIADVTLV